MTRLFNPGEQINGYTIERQFSSGSVSTAYVARTAAGKAVFFKVFKSPTPTVAWYAGFIAYQQAMKDRIESSPLKHYVGSIVEFFEAPLPPRNTTRAYFQVFDFIERGKDLRAFTCEMDESTRNISWERRLTWAKVVMASVHQLHAHGIAHGDLKPENLMLVEDSAIKVGYRLRVIDIDYAIMTDRKAPWHGSMGYLGTPSYLSPEHLRGAVPQPASDVFTSAIVLSELLFDVHPFAEHTDVARYASAVKRHELGPLLDACDKAAGAAPMLATLHAMLDPDPARRPSADAVLRVLKTLSPAATPAPTLPLLAATTGALVSRARTAQRVTLEFKPAFRLQMAVSTALNQRLVRRAGVGSRYWDRTCQCSLERTPEGWFVVPNLSACNETLHNGRALRERVQLRSGDELAVGRQARNLRFAPALVALE